jgi:hypothetical protein
MTRILQDLTDTLADAALFEMGVPGAEKQVLRRDSESLEENLVEVAFAEESDFEEIHEAILREHWDERDTVRPDDCQYGDNDLCAV